VAAAPARSMERSDRRRRQRCLLTPPGLTGYDSKVLKEMEEEDC
jgi:hypothetical protein